MSGEFVADARWMDRRRVRFQHWIIFGVPLAPQRRDFLDPALSLLRAGLIGSGQHGGENGLGVAQHARR